MTTWVGYETAGHLVTTFCDKGGGIVASLPDELSAYRVAKVYKDLGYRHVEVVPNDDDSMKAIHEQINAWFES